MYPLGGDGEASRSDDAVCFASTSGELRMDMSRGVFATGAGDGAGFAEALCDALELGGAVLGGEVGFTVSGRVAGVDICEVVGTLMDFFALTE